LTGLTAQPYDGIDTIASFWERMLDRIAYVVGVGMTPFAKPGTSAPYHVMAEQAGRSALEDARVEYSLIEQVYASYVYADSTAGQAAVYGLGLSGIPIINLNNNCSSGSSALFLARQAIEFGMAECVLAIGFEQMIPGALGDTFRDRPAPMTRHADSMKKIQGAPTDAPIAAQYFGGAGAEYASKHGTKPETFAQISVKARRHAANNPYAVFRSPLTLDEVLASPHVFGPLTRFQCCPPTCGSAAVVVCSRSFLKKHGLTHAVPILAQTMVTDGSGTFSEGSMMDLIGSKMAENAACRAYERAGIAPSDVDVVELHDCFTANELISYEALQIAPVGEAERFICDNQNTYGGSCVVNPSGGLLSKGHPLGATGLAQCAELVWQMRGRAEARQVEDARIALQHNLGLGGACIVSIYGQAGQYVQ
jgi:sterol carrier protein 2